MAASGVLMEEAKTTDLESINLWSLFRDVLHVNHKRHSLYFDQLWDSITPNGNIYRRNAFYLEHRLHSLDLWYQMRNLAEKHRSLLQTENSASIEDCAEVLYKELQNTTFHIPGSDHEAADKMSGYPPIEEFLCEKVEQWGPFVMYSDPDKRAEEMKHRLIALNVFLLQVIAPFLIFMNRWGMPTNHFKRMFDRDYVFHKLTVAELLCFGTTFEDGCTTLLGMQLLFAIIFITRCYVDQQVTDARKWQRLPHSSFWISMDVFANSWCVVFIMLGVPLLFWSEETPTNIVLDSMTLLFLFNLDSLSDILCSYVGMTQSDFQRTVACMIAFLAECPVDLHDVIDADAKSSNKLWCIQVDTDGKVLGSNGLPCTTRLQYTTEKDGAVRPPSGHSARLNRRWTHYGSSSAVPEVETLPSSKSSKLICHRSRSNVKTLPSYSDIFLASLWDILAWIVWMGNIVIPILWYLINKPCYPLSQGAGTSLSQKAKVPP